MRLHAQHAREALQQPLVFLGGAQDHVLARLEFQFELLAGVQPAGEVGLTLCYLDSPGHRRLIERLDLRWSQAERERSGILSRLLAILCARDRQDILVFN